MTVNLKPHLLNDLKGKSCRLTQIAYVEDLILNLNSDLTARLIQSQDIYGTVFIFLDVEPYYKFNRYWYCIADKDEIADTEDVENWYWFSLNQLILCKE